MLTISKVPYDVCEHTKSSKHGSPGSFAKIGDYIFKMAGNLSNLKKT